MKSQSSHYLMPNFPPIFHQIGLFRPILKIFAFWVPIPMARVPFGPNFTKNWVPVGSQFWQTWVPMTCGFSVHPGMIAWSQRMFLTLLRISRDGQPQLFVCKRPQGGAVCGLQFTTLMELRNHRGECTWVCPVEGCGRKEKKEREINYHKSMHRRNDAKRAAVLNLLADFIP